MNQNGLTNAAGALFGKTFQLSITRNYVSNWGVLEAIRELIQNAIDSESPFKYEFIQSEQGLGLKLQSEFSTLTPQTLLLGATSKVSSDTAIGSFGEGYKIALLVLTRLGYNTEVLNGGLVWTPCFRMSRTFGEEVLCIDQHTASDRSNKGLTFIVWGVEEIKEGIIDSCLQMQRDIGEIKETTEGIILIDKPGKLYVGGLFICDTELKHGYNLKPGAVKLERDRQTVDGWNLKLVTTRMWMHFETPTTLAQMIYDEVPDVAYADYNAPEIVRNACFELFKERHPGALIASSPKEMKEMVEKGLTKTVYIGSTYAAVVHRTDGYKSLSTSQKAAIATPTQRLSAWFSEHRSEMRTKAIVGFKELLKESEKWSVK